MQLGRLRILRRDRWRSAQESPLQVIGPAMEAAAEGLARASRRTHDLHVLMAAGVAQHMDRAFLVTHGNDAPAADRRRDEIAGPGDLPFSAERQGLRRENRAFLGLEGITLGIILGFHGFCIRYLEI